jgi:hypothetical protein
VFLSAAFAAPIMSAKSETTASRKRIIVAKLR